MSISRLTYGKVMPRLRSTPLRVDTGKASQPSVRFGSIYELQTVEGRTDERGEYELALKLNSTFARCKRKVARLVEGEELSPNPFRGWGTGVFQITGDNGKAQVYVLTGKHYTALHQYLKDENLKVPVAQSEVVKVPSYARTPQGQRFLDFLGEHQEQVKSLFVPHTATQGNVERFGSRLMSLQAFLMRGVDVIKKHKLVKSVREYIHF